MPLFRYKALTETGKRVSGVIDADSLEMAKERLRRDRVMVTKLDTAGERKEVCLSPALLLAFTRELGQLLKAGLPLYESLLTIEEKYRKTRSHPLFLDLCDRLRGGEKLSTILKRYPKSFDAIYVSMVEAGEKTGALPWAFEQLFELIERRQKLKKQLISAMAYPAFLGAFCLLVVIGLLLFVIPSMQELFEGRRLHPLTQLVLSWSQFMQSNGLFMVIGITLIIMSLGAFFRRNQGRYALQKALHKVPLVKTVLLEAALIRFCRSCSILLSGGVPLVQSLTISRRAMKHSLLEEVVERAESQIIEGRPLSHELGQSERIPPLVSRMLAISEETGNLPEMFKNLSDIYDSELERSLGHITTFLQPALLILLGGVVGLVILSILLPLTDVGSLISNT